MADIINPIVIRTRPYRAEQNVSPDSSIVIEFSEEMDANTLDSYNIILTDDELNTIDTSISYSNRIATISPLNYLRPDTEYQVLILGDNDSLDESLTGVKDLEGNPLVGNYRWTFKTSPTFIAPTITPSTAPSNPEDVSTPSSISDPSNPSDVSTVSDPSCPVDSISGDPYAAGYLRVVSSNPKQLAYNLPLEIGEIRIQFDNRIDPISILEPGSITIEVEPVNGDPSILHPQLIPDILEQSTTWDLIKLDADPKIDPSALPSGYTVSDAFLISSASGADVSGWFVPAEPPSQITRRILKITDHLRLDTTAICLDTLVIGTDLMLAPNCEYRIRLSNTNTVRDIAGRKLHEEYVLYFTSLYNPAWVTPNAIRMKLGKYIDSVPDDTIYRYIFDSSLYAYNLLRDVEYEFSYRVDSNGNRILVPPYFAVEFVKCRAAWSLLNGLMFGSLVGFAADSKTLGSFAVKYGGNSNSDALDNLRDSLAKCAERGENIIISSAGRGKRVISAVKALYNPRRPNESRLWADIKNGHPYYSDTPIKYGIPSGRI